ncbi:hypothetical protein V6N13_053226 [Hibiscus sabdariffa]
MRSVLVHVNHVVGGSAVLQSRLAKRGERAVYGLLDPLKTITDIADDVLLLSQNINYEELREIQWFVRQHRFYDQFVPWQTRLKGMSILDRGATMVLELRMNRLVGKYRKP